MEFTKEEREAAQEKVCANPVWNSPIYPTFAIELQCKLDRALALLKEARTRLNVHHGHMCNGDFVDDRCDWCQKVDLLRESE